MLRKYTYLAPILFFLLCFSLTPLTAQTTIFEEDFETDGNGSRYTVTHEFFDGKDDYFGRVYGPTEEYGGMGTGNVIDVIGNGTSSTQIGMYTGYHGNFFVAGEDQDDNGGDGIDEKSITFNPIDISNASGLTFRGLFGAGNTNSCAGNQYDATDYIEVYYSVDGAPEVLALCFNNDSECNIPGDNTNEPLHHDPNCDNDGGEGTMMTNALVERSFSIPDGNSLTLRIESHMDAGNEEIGYDWFRVEAVTVGPTCMADAGTLTGTSETICAGGTSSVTIAGNQTDAAYTQVYLIADAALNVTSIQSSTTLTFATPGTFTVYSYNYETAGSAPSNPATIGAIDCNANCCDLEAGVFTIVVLPNVTGTFTAPPDLCIDAGVQAGLGGGTPTGGVYSGPGVVDDGNGMTYSFDPAAAGVGMHTLTYTPAGLCETPASDNIVVFALPNVDFTSPPDYCIDAGVQAGLGGGTPTGGMYAGPGVTDDGNGVTYTFDPVAAGPGVHSITYSLTDFNGCTGSDSDELEVFNTPTVTFSAPADLCVDAGVQAGLGGGLPTGGVYSGPGVIDDGNGMTYSFDPAVAGVGIHTITYDFTDANGCNGSDSDMIEVLPLTDPSCSGGQDSDNDGIPDTADNCPNDPNPDQADPDGDGVGEVCDNCLRKPNPDQLDSDNDMIGDACDKCDFIPFDSQNDPDKDGLGDECDNCPNVKNGNQGDRDSDGVGNKCDNCIEVFNPDQADSDNNGVGDACEPVALGKADDDPQTEKELLLGENLANNFTLYPNPTTGQLTLDVSAYLGQEVEILISHQTGKVLWSLQLDEVQTTTIVLDMREEGIAAGYYYVVCKTDRSSAIQSVIVTE